MKLKTLLAFPLLLGLASCSSIVSKSDYPVTVMSAKPTTVKIQNKSTGKIVHQGMTPTTATLSASEGFFQPAKYSLQTKTSQHDMNASMDPWYAGNIVFGGLVGLLIVDPATGNMWKLPQEVHINN